ncbi:MAG: NAD(P)H-hydrate epimerase [Planctomycetes bacterium]|nr:NAD(P)H-hydrate epimerase [Planctomycetota bacterium]
MAIPYPPGEALTCRQIRELDVLAIEHVGIPGMVLMENAGRGVAEFVYDKLTDPRSSSVLIMCGAGNNGGDGFVVARHLRNAGVRVVVALAAARARSQGDAGLNLRILERLDADLRDAFEPAGLEAVRVEAEEADIIVDALLGTGSKGAPRGTMAELIALANAAPRARRIAIDIPSGLDADLGEVAEPCFRADATYTLLAEKLGFATAAARAVLGRVVVGDIGCPRKLIPGRKNNCQQA